jgi:hypothetical protein
MPSPPSQPSRPGPLDAVELDLVLSGPSPFLFRLGDVPGAGICRLAGEVVGSAGLRDAGAVAAGIAARTSCGNSYA